MNNDPISDLFVQLKNAQKINKQEIKCPASILKQNILKILKDNNFIIDFNIIKDKNKSYFEIKMNSKKPFHKLSRISLPSIRRYIKINDLKKLSWKNEIMIISTSRGILTAKDAVRQGLGGEFIGVCN